MEASSSAGTRRKGVNFQACRQRLPYERRHRSHGYKSRNFLFRLSPLRVCVLRPFAISKGSPLDFSLASRRDIRLVLKERFARGDLRRRMINTRQVDCENVEKLTRGSVVTNDESSPRSCERVLSPSRCCINITDGKKSGFSTDCLTE